MPKSDLPIGGEYAPVADRIALFYERFPAGRIITHLTMHNEREIVFRATVYRTERSRAPAATGWASERIGDGDVNTVACLEKQIHWYENIKTGERVEFKPANPY